MGRAAQAASAAAGDLKSGISAELAML